MSRPIPACIALLATLFGITTAPNDAVARTSPDSPEAVCYAVQSQVNTLVDYTSTRCWPAAQNSFVIVSEKSVFLSSAAKKAWLLTVVASVGKQMNDRNLSGKEIVVSDVANTKRRIAWSLPVPLTRSLQQRVKNDQITLDAMYAEIVRHLEQVSIPATQ